MPRQGIQPHKPDERHPLAVSLKTLALRLDAHRSSVRRWLREAGIQPIAVSDQKTAPSVTAGPMWRPGSPRANTSTKDPPFRAAAPTTTSRNATSAVVSVPHE